jgi:hypothetical protein
MRQVIGIHSSKVRAAGKQGNLIEPRGQSETQAVGDDRHSGIAHSTRQDERVVVGSVVHQQ